MLTVGETGITIEFVLLTTGVFTVPFEYAEVKGPLTVKIMVILPLVPTHKFGVVVESVAVGKFSTVTFIC